MSFQMNHVGLKKKKKGFFREITEKNIPLFQNITAWQTDTFIGNIITNILLS